MRTCGFRKLPRDSLMVVCYCFHSYHNSPQRLPPSATTITRISRLSSFKVRKTYRYLILELKAFSFYTMYIYVDIFIDAFHRFTGNYGVLGVLDRLHGTDKVFRESSRFRKHRFVFSSRTLTWCATLFLFYVMILWVSLCTKYWM